MLPYSLSYRGSSTVARIEIDATLLAVVAELRRPREKWHHICCPGVVRTPARSRNPDLLPYYLSYRGSSTVARKMLHIYCRGVVQTPARSRRNPENPESRIATLFPHVPGQPRSSEIPAVRIICCPTANVGGQLDPREKKGHHQPTTRRRTWPFRPSCRSTISSSCPVFRPSLPWAASATTQASAPSRTPPRCRPSDWEAAV